MDEKNTIYFKKPGDSNTATCLNLVKAEVEDNGFKYVIVASTTGETGIVFADALKGLDADLMVISYGNGEQKDSMPPEIRQKIINKGATLFNAPSLSFNIDRSLGSECQKCSPSSIIANTLSIFGQGMKVCCESVLAAVDGGLIAEGIEVLCVAGTISGADTVAVVRATSSKNFRELRVREMLARPR